MKVIILYGHEPYDAVTQEYKSYISKAIKESTNPEDHKLLGDGKKSISQLLEEDHVKKALEAADDDTLVIIRAHGIYLERDNEVVGHVISEGTHNVNSFTIIDKLPKTVKNVKVHFCHSGSMFRSDVKELKETKETKEEKAEKESAIAGRLISAGESRKYPSLASEARYETIKFIQNSTNLTPKQAIIADRLLMPTSSYFSNSDAKGVIKFKKLARLFRGVKLEDVKPGSINQLMDNFIDNRVKELLELFPEEEDFIKKTISAERESVREDLIKRAPYLYAVRGTLEVMQILAKSGADMNVANEQGFTPLFYVSYKSVYSPEIIKFLLSLTDEKGEKIIDPNINDPSGQNLLDRADKFNFKEIIKILLKDDRFFPEEFDETTKFLISCKRNHKNIAYHLLQDPDVDPNAQDSSGNIGLINLYEFNKHDASLFVPFVRDRVTDLNIQNNLGNNLLMFIAAAGDRNSAKYLLNSDNLFDLTLKNNQGSTALTIARIYKNHDVAYLILKKMEAQLFEACKSGDHKTVVEILSTQEIDVNLKDDSWGITLLMYASNTNLATVKSILENKKTNPNISDNAHRTALMYSCQQDNVEITKILLANSADPNLKTPDGKTALYFACKNNQPAAVKELLKAGAKLPEENDRQKLLDKVGNEKTKKEITEIFNTHAKKLEESLNDNPQISETSKNIKSPETKEQKGESIPSFSPAQGKSKTLIEKNSTEIEKNH